MTEDTTGQMNDQIEQFLSHPFNSLVASLATSALSAIGMMANPMTGKVEKDLSQAEMTIEILAALQEKTKNNLTAEEKMFLDSQLSELRMLYVDALKKEKPIS